ncbi:MAG: hypothetical protein AAGC82_14200 [Pseudomonadota bacterium]
MQGTRQRLGSGARVILRTRLSVLLALLLLSPMARDVAQAQTSIDANKVPLGAVWSILITDIAEGQPGQETGFFTFLAGTELTISAEVEASFDGRTVPVNGAIVVLTLGGQRVQSATDANGLVAEQFRTDRRAGLYPADAFLISGTVDAAATETVTLYDYVVDMPQSIDVDSSGVQSGFIDAVLRRRQPDANGVLQMTEPGPNWARDMEAVRFIGNPELELFGDRNRSTEARIYETVPGDDGRMEVRVRSEWTGRYTIRAVGIGGRYRLSDQTLGATEVVVDEQVSDIQLEFGPSMDRYADGPGRIVIENVDINDDTPIELEIIASGRLGPEGGVDIRIDRATGADIQLSGQVMTSFVVDGAVRPSVWEPGIGPQELRVSADGSNVLTVVVIGVDDDEEVAFCPEIMRTIAEHQGGIDACGTGQPLPDRMPHPLDGIWRVQPGETEDRALLAFIRRSQSAEFAVLGRRAPEVAASYLGDPSRGTWPSRIGYDLSVEGALQLTMGNGPSWSFTTGTDQELLSGNWTYGNGQLDAQAVRLSGAPDIDEIAVEVAGFGIGFRAQSRVVDRLQAPNDMRPGQLAVVPVDFASDGGMCNAVIPTWIELSGDGFAGGHDVWIDPASYLQISPMSGWRCSDGQMTVINGGQGEGWGNCTLGAPGDPVAAVTGIFVGLCAREGVVPAPVDLWVNGTAIPFEISVYASIDEIPDFDESAASPVTDDTDSAATDELENPPIDEEEADDADRSIALFASNTLSFTGRAMGLVEIVTNQTLSFQGWDTGQIDVSTNETLYFEGHGVGDVAVSTSQTLFFQGWATGQTDIATNQTLNFVGRGPPGKTVLERRQVVLPTSRWQTAPQMTRRADLPVARIGDTQ